MKTIPDSIQVKLEHTKELHDRIFICCYEQVKSPDEQRLKKIGAYLGDMANNMRSALNFAVRHFAEDSLQGLISPKTNVDFPVVSAGQAEFDKIKVIRVIKEHFPHTYNFLESVQPYHKGNSWLEHIIHLSNTDKHITINEVNVPDIVSLGTTSRSTFRVKVLGNKVVIWHTTQPETFHFRDTPYFVYAYQMFVSEEGKWISFRTPLRENLNLDVMRFIELTPNDVQRVISQIYELM